MAYCRFWSQDGRCDIYVCPHIDGDWVTDVATARWPEGAPALAIPVFADPAWTQKSPDQISEEYSRRAKLREDWEVANPPMSIDHPAAGGEFRHATPGACADNLEKLGAAGFNFPPEVIDILRAEQLEDALGG